MGLAEVRWTGFGETIMDDGLRLWYCEEDVRNEYDMGFLVHRKVAGGVISCAHVYSRHSCFS